jgi:ABC-type dipeptide/oligopeptide/nickel transport system permease subunit
MDSWRVEIIPEPKPVKTLVKSVNLSFFIGLSIVFVILILAVFGPFLAPKDPLKENFLVYLNDTTFAKPPLPAFAVPGFPLGSDEFGRDLFSRLLWAVRPTFTLALVVASLRLILGTILGLISGWSNDWPGRLIHAALTAGLAIPVLFVALFTIAAAGQQYGFMGFHYRAFGHRLVRCRSDHPRSNPQGAIARVCRSLCCVGCWKSANYF